MSEPPAAAYVVVGLGFAAGLVTALFPRVSLRLRLYRPPWWQPADDISPDPSGLRWLRGVGVVAMLAFGGFLLFLL